LLTGVTAADEAGRRRMDTTRIATNEAIAELRRRIALLTDDKDTPEIGRVRTLTGEIEALDAARLASRRAVDRDLARPLSGRDPGLTQAHAAAEMTLQQRFVPLLNGLQARVAVGASDAASVIQIARYAADLRELAGLQASLVTAPIADRRPFTLQELQSAERVQGEIDRLRTQIDAAIEYVGNPPALADAWRIAQAGYFARGQRAIDRVLASGAVDGRYPIPLAEFIPILIVELPSLIALRDAASAAATQEAIRSRDAAWDSVMASGAVLFAMVAAVGVLTAWFRRWVVVPLIGLTVKVELLAGGNRDVEIGLTDRHDEIGGLTRAMRVFHRTLIEVERLAAELRLQMAERAKAEDERQKLYGQLLQSQKMEAIGTMAGGVAHELNNLLQPILILSELLGDRFPEEDEESRQDLAVIVDCTRRARDIVGNIVMFARKTTANVTTLDVAQETRAAGPLFRSLLPTTVSLDEQIPDEPCLAVINRTELVQVLTNLVINASQAMNQCGTVRIVVERAQIAPSEAAALQISPGCYAAVSVIDTGRGIDAALCNRIFEPFFTTKPVGQGTGLGLSVAYGIVRAWHGAIRVDSRVDHGSTFSVLIPMLHA
jgi:signal transduction histidine kinase